MRFLFISALLLTACQHDTRYFGNTTPPAGQTLVYANSSEPSSLDNAMIIAEFEENIVFSLYEALTRVNPLTTEPMAGMATHYEIGADGVEYTFYLRGHPRPRGTRLPDIDSLPAEFTHGAHAPADAVPALWSDGSTVTAADFVAAVRRSLDPKTASPQMPETPVLVNEAEVRAGKLSPSALGVDAPDRFTLRFRLTHPVPWFLTTTALTTPDPRAKGTSWLKAGSFIGNGPFVLDEWRPYEHVKVRRNPGYYLRDLVRLDEIKFLPVGAGAAVMNLYLSGRAQAIYSDSMPFSIVPALRATEDFHSDPQWSLQLILMNLHEPPFDDPRVRQAVNMGIDKRALARYWQSEPAWSPIPAMPGYRQPTSAMVGTGSGNYDVMAYDPAAARRLLAEAGYSGVRRLSFTMNTPSTDAGLQTAEILRQQLQRNLGADVRVRPEELKVIAQDLTGASSHGASLIGNWTADYADPDSMLDRGLISFYAGWHDAGYFAALEAANRELNPGVRMGKLAECETRLIQAMAVIPVSGYPAFSLVKPYVRGLHENKLGTVDFRYAWIDHGWRP